jgi:hypothetical protein
VDNPGIEDGSCQPAATGNGEQHAVERCAQAKITGEVEDQQHVEDVAKAVERDTTGCQRAQERIAEDGVQPFAKLPPEAALFLALGSVRLLNAQRQEKARRDEERARINDDRQGGGQPLDQRPG